MFLEKHLFFLVIILKYLVNDSILKNKYFYIICILNCTTHINNTIKKLIFEQGFLKFKKLTVIFPKLHSNNIFIFSLVHCLIVLKINHSE